ncbi:MAG: hypothetical protein KJN78_04525 [Gammaproteobacteria bacterium]|nr:hypothetical protein [Gammaproteobacteria bacterium]
MTIHRELVRLFIKILKQEGLTKALNPSEFAQLKELTERLDEEVSADDQKAIEFARQEYCNDEIEVDDDCYFSHADCGVWVAGWLWVPHEEIGLDAEGS